MLNVFSTAEPVGKSWKYCGTPEASKLDMLLPTALKMLFTVLPMSRRPMSSAINESASLRGKAGAGVIIGCGYGIATATGNSQSIFHCHCEAMSTFEILRRPHGSKFI
jgi:hypothetical protein